MTQKQGPGRAHRAGISLVALAEMFPTEDAARDWFEAVRWPNGITCPYCDGDSIARPKNAKPMPYRCRACRKHFSPKTGTVMAESKLSLKKWVWAIYLCSTSLKGVSSMKLHRDLDITQKSAWFLAHRIREAMGSAGAAFTGPVEVDETFFGGKEANKHESQRTHRRGHDDKFAVVGVLDRETKQVRARAIGKARGNVLRAFVRENAEAGAQIYTDGHMAYWPLDGEYKHDYVQHSVGDYVRGQAHTNGIESFWAMLKRGYQGTFHHFSGKHLQRYVDEFATRQGLRERDTIDLMGEVVGRMVGKRLTYERLVEGEAA